MRVLEVPDPAALVAGRGAEVAPTRIGALDGLRAVAVAAVVVFHLAPDALPGGYLGVDLFMVLSGFLITGILLDERTRTGGVRLGAFWGRRFRRLVPAVLLLLTTVAVWVGLGWRELAPTVRGQGLAALVYAANWQLVADGVSYAALQDPASPLLHLWSLAVEEQFYVLWPPLVALALASRRGRQAVAALAAAGAAGSALLMARWFHPGLDPLRLYYGTDTRAHTFLVGALAALLVRRTDPAAVASAVRRWGVVALGLVVVAFRLGDEGAWAYRGGFAVFALVAAVAVVATTVPGPVRSLLDRSPLRLIGRTSYGIYLWHWPILVLVREDEVGVGGAGLLAIRLALLALATAASWHLVERPAARVPRRALVLAGTLGIAATAAALLALPTRSLLAYADVDVDEPPPVSVSPPAPSTSAPPTSAGGVPTTTGATPPPPAGTLLVIGDSGTYDAAPAIAAGFTTAGWTVVNSAYAGVGLTRPDGVRDRWSEAVAANDPDLVLVLLGGWDSDFILEHGDDAYRAELADVVAMLSRDGARILWLTPLPGGDPIPADPDRLFAELPDAFPGVVEHADLSASLAGPDGDYPRSVGDRLLRKPDGWHLCPDGAAALTTAILTRLGVPSDGWQDGEWRADARFDDPPGGCRT